MHIAFLTPEFPHEKVSHAAGIGTSIKNLTTALVHNGCAVSVFVYGQKISEIIIENGCTIHLIAKKKYRFSTWFFHRKFIQQYLNSKIISENPGTLTRIPIKFTLMTLIEFRNFIIYINYLLLR